MATVPSKTVQTSLVAWQDIATANVIVGSAVDVSTKWAGAFSIRLGRRSGSAFTANWPNVRIEGSLSTSGNNSWIPIYTYQMSLGASIANTTCSGAISAGASTFSVNGSTNIAAGDVLFIGHTTLTANYELARVKSVVGNLITPEEALTNAHDNTAPVTDQAEMVFPSLDLTCYNRVRAVVDNAGGGQTMAADVTLTSFDSF